MAGTRTPHPLVDTHQARVPLPFFPPKSIFKNKAQRVAERQDQFQVYLQAIAESPDLVLVEPLLSFLAPP